MATQRTESTVDQIANLSKSLDGTLRELKLISKSLGVIALRFLPERPKSNTDRIWFLRNIGFDRNEIAAILDVPEDSVSVRISEKKRPTKPAIKKNKKAHGKKNK